MLTLLILGMSICGESLTVEEIKWRKKKEAVASDVKTNAVCNALKYYDSDFTKDLVNANNLHCKDYIEQYEVSVSNTPCRVTLCNSMHEDDAIAMIKGLQSDGSPLSAHEDILPTTLEPVRQNARSGVTAAIDAVRKALKAANHTLFRGQVHSRPAKAMFTYVPLDSIENYCHKLLKYPAIGQYLLDHIDVVIKRLKHPSCSIIEQMKVNFDLIEVNDGQCWQISKRQFVACPYTEAEVGIISPRMFCEFDASEPPQPRFFKSSILNSCPDPASYARLLNKWYQLLLHEKMLHKVRKLLVWGPSDSGKSTWLEPLRGIIPDKYIASITKEGKFGTSMITADTQLTFIDEFVPGIIPDWRAKQLFQGGILYNSYKFENNSNMVNHSPYLITAQVEPNFGEEDANIKRRLYIVKTRPLQHTIPGVEKWLKDNAIHCIVWAGEVINKHRDKIEPEELFYELGNPGMLHKGTEVNAVHDKALHYARLEDTYATSSSASKRPKELFYHERTSDVTPLPTSLQLPSPTSPESILQFNYSPDP